MRVNLNYMEKDTIRYKLQDHVWRKGVRRVVSGGGGVEGSRVPTLISFVWRKLHD